MDRDLKKLVELIFKEKTKEFEKFIEEYKNLSEFKIKYKKMLLKYFDLEDFNELDEYLSESFLFLMFGRNINKIYSIDWSGEEYPGEVKTSLTKMLKTFGKETFNWNSKKFHENIDYNLLRKGDYISLLFRELDNNLLKMDFQILFIDLYDDEYHYTILPKVDIKNALQLSGKDFQTLDSKIYEIYVNDTGENKSKLMLYLKKKNNINLNDIKEYILNTPILVEKGNIIKIKETEKELNKIGCEYSINEIEIKR